MKRVSNHKRYNLNLIAAAFIALLLLYYEVYRWIPLGRFNWQFSWPVQNDQFYPDIVIGVLLLFFALSFFYGWAAVKWIAVILLSLWVVTHFLDWWLPYLKNDVANYPRYSFYEPHTQILPVIDHHYPPDAGHAILDFLLFPAWVLSLLALIKGLISKSR